MAPLHGFPASAPDKPQTSPSAEAVIERDGSREGHAGLAEPFPPAGERQRSPQQRGRVRQPLTSLSPSYCSESPTAQLRLAKVLVGHAVKCLVIAGAL